MVITKKKNGDQDALDYYSMGDFKLKSYQYKPPPLLTIPIAVSMLKGAWVISPGELEMEQEIGSGAFGTVHKATWRGMAVAVKVMRGELLHWDGGASAGFECEASFMRTVRHPNIVLFFGAGSFEDGVWMLL